MLSSPPFPIEGRRVLLLAEGCFSTFGAKTAVCFLRYRGRDVVAVLDSSREGKSVSQVLGFGGDVPIVGSIRDALSYRPEIALVGVAPMGGELDESFRGILLALIERGVDVISGLHEFLGEDPEFLAAQKASGSRIWDVRRVAESRTVASGKGCTTGAKTVLIAGTDCDVGKMTCTYELYLEAKRRGVKAAWAATGQTGIILRGQGIAIDRVISDFVGGAAEELVNCEGRGQDVVFVEGQGSLMHPGYAGVTLGLMFGVVPDCIILAHEPQRATIRDYEVRIPPIGEVAAFHEKVIEPLKKVPVVGVSLNTCCLGEKEARESIDRLREESGLAVGDPVRFGCGEILDAALGYLSLGEETR